MSMFTALLEKARGLALAAEPFRNGFTYDPGHSDLDNEQPIFVKVTLGDWRRLNRELLDFDRKGTK